MRSLSMPALALAFLLAAAPAAADLLDPLDFASLGSLALTSGSFTVDTDAVTITDDANPGVPLYTGVIDDQQGQADSYGPGGDVTTVGPAGVPHVAVFAFDDVALESGASITVVGHRALALLSRGNAFIDTSLALRDEPGTQLTNPPIGTTLPGRRGGPGGFAGGSGLGVATPEAGWGPGGGGGSLVPANTFGTITGGRGGHGSAGPPGSCTAQVPCFVVGAGGAATSDPLDAVLRGGSGGGGSASTVQGTIVGWIAGGAGGGGALEIGALGTLTVGPAGSLDVSIGFFQRNQITSNGQTLGTTYGSAGALRLHAARLVNLGSANLLARHVFQTGAAGTILLRGVDAAFVVGQSTIVPAQLGVDVTNGVLSVRVSRVTVLEGDSLELSGANVVQAQTLSLPRIEVGFDSVEIRDAATGSVPVGGFVNTHEVRLGGPTARITGSDPFSNDGVVRGTGSIEVPFTNGASGRVDVSHEDLAFTQGMLNVAGGSINVLVGSLTVPGDALPNDDGLVNLGNLNLIDAVVDGDVRSPGGSAIQVAGAATFNGLFSGAAGFSGTQNLVVFNGGYQPGDSAAQIGFGGDLAFGSLGVLALELGGLLAGSEHDRLDVAGELALAGGVELAAIDGFVPPLGASFTLLTHGARSGEFTSVAGIQQPGDLDLALRYAGGAVVANVVRRGDVNGDGQLTEADSAIVAAAAALGLTTTAYGAGDVDGSGGVDAADVTIVEIAVAGGGPSIPALGSWLKALLALGLCAAVLVRARRRIAAV
ncbi:MAG: dockerin type I domain-containing protein [Myxococcota bacterium]